MEIRKITASEAPELLSLSRQTFYDAFADKNDPEDMDAYAATNFTLSKIETELSNIGSDFYFAVLNGEVIGYLKLNSGKAQTEFQEADSLEVERIYVLASRQGNKAGEQLLNFAINKAVEHGCTFIWLGVWENNTNAIRFYQRHGFVEFSQHYFMLGNDQQVDILLRREL